MKPIRTRFLSLFALLGALAPYRYHAEEPHIRQTKELGRKCLLPDCTLLTTHNGGYCSAAHCRLHRERMKRKP